MNKRMVIVEDEYFAANHLKKLLLKNGCEVVGMYHDGETVLKELSLLEETIFLLDIQLTSEISGINLAVELEKRGIPFIFITANTEEGTFNSAIITKPVAYISKPFKELDVIAGVRLASQKLNNKIAIESGSEKFLIDAEDVLYFKSDNVYVELFVENDSFLIRKQLKELEDELSSNFKRCQKSYIVNVHKISKIKGSSIYLNDIEIPLSRTYRGNFL